MQRRCSDRDARALVARSHALIAAKLTRRQRDAIAPRPQASTMTEHFDTLETRDPELRERALMDALPRQIAHAKANAPAFARILGGVDPAAVTSRAALAAVPVTRKSDLLELQKAERPFGGLAAVKPRRSRARLRIAGPDLRAGEPAARPLAPRARAVRRRISRRAISSTTRSPIISRRRARCSRPARTRSGARCFPPAPGRPSSRCRRSPSLRRTATSARRRSCRIILEKADELRHRAAVAAQGARFRGGVSAQPARCARGARHRGLPGLRERRSGLDRLRDRGARRARRRRGRAGRARAAGHRRSRWRPARSARSS